MQAIRVALIQIGWLGNRDAMMEQYQQLIGRAVSVGAELVCLPEFSLSPYFANTRDQAGFAWAEPTVGGESEQFFRQQAAEHEIALIGSLFEKAEDGRYFDTATIHGPSGDLIGVTRKIHIPSGEGYNETDFFEGWDEYPVFDIGALKVATPTCYDQWFPELARIYTLNGAEFVFYPTAIGSEPTDPHIDTQSSWETVMRGHAIANGIFVGATNRIGQEGSVRFYGSSFVCDPTGKILAQAERDTVEVVIADLEPYTFTHWRELFPLLRQRRPAIYQRITKL